ncbi:MAG: putative LPS assembly protein LptD [Chitinophagales bacterium]|nr:putative LPS assembly protein LptD [Chitinophagales bacterium]
MKRQPFLFLFVAVLAAYAFTGGKAKAFVIKSGQAQSFVVDTLKKNKLSLGSSSNDSTANNKTDSLIKNYNSGKLAIGTSPIDSLPKDSLTSDSLVARKDSLQFKVSKDSIDQPIKYSALDSIVYDIAAKKVYLYDSAQVQYKEITMKAHFITVDWSESVITGETALDSTGNPTGDVVFINEGQEYRSKKLAYNFKTKRGIVTQARTQEDQGYVHIKQGVRTPEEEWYGKKGWYTTCSEEHPHFYIESERMKLVPDKVMVTGPAHLVIRDVPTPLYLPFGIFPVKKGRRSGIIMPQYGEDGFRGFFFREGGYYFGISNNFDLALKGDIYTNGTWAIKAYSNYVKRYKYNGNLFLQFGRNRRGEPESPSFQIGNDFAVNWRFDQDRKARPYSYFTANVNFSSSTYNQNFTYSQESVTKSQVASKVNYTNNFRGKPLSMSVAIEHDQNLFTRQVNLTLPRFSLITQRIQPFKRKTSSGELKWYENLNFNYSFETQNVVRGIDSTFFTKETLKNAQYGIKQTVPVSTSIKVFKYFSLTPSAAYTERWYFKTVEKTWDPDTIYRLNTPGDSIVDTIYGQVVADTSFGFNGSRDFNFALTLTTKVYGMVQFKGGKLKAIRHVMTPSLSFNGRPDFSKPFWGNYKEVQVNAAGKREKYSIFEPSNSIYGDAPQGPVAGMRFSLANVLEMKVHSEKDTIKHEKKVKLLDNLIISGFYNFIADSLQLDPISITGYTTLFDKLNINFNMSFDPYMHDSLNRRINTFVWTEKRKFTQLRSAGVTIGTSLQSGKGGLTSQKVNASNATEQEKAVILAAPSLYYDFTVPWSISFNYSLTLARGVTGNPDTIVVNTNSFNFSADVTITEKWKVHLESGYDFKIKDLIYTRLSVIRDMHCWELSARWVPYPLDRQSYDMQLNVKAQVLQDLKLSRKNQASPVF